MPIKYEVLLERTGKRPRLELTFRRQPTDDETQGDQNDHGQVKNIVRFIETVSKALNDSY
jgi:hypothetical protein